MKVSIIGAGNTGLALAVHLLARGHEPLLYTRDSGKEQTFNAHDLTVTGELAGSYRIPTTTDMARIVRHGEVTVVCTWANAHRSVFEALYATAASESRPVNLLVFNGNWGALEALDVRRSANPDGDGPREAFRGDICESAGMPYVALHDGLTLHIGAIKTSITVASALAGPAVDGPARALLEDLYAQVEYAGSVFETSLSAPNPIIHAPVCLLNMTKIEQGVTFHMLTDGFTERTERLVGCIDRERHALARALGVAYTPIVRQLNGFWGSDYPTLRELFRSSPVYRGVLGPASVGHRFIQEDVPYGVAPLVSLGRLLGVPTPTDAMLLALYSDYFGTAFHGPAFTRELIDAVYRPEARPVEAASTAEAKDSR